MQPIKASFHFISYNVTFEKATSFSFRSLTVSCDALALTPLYHLTFFYIKNSTETLGCLHALCFDGSDGSAQDLQELSER